MQMVRESLVCRAFAVLIRRLAALWNSLGHVDIASVPAPDDSVSQLERLERTALESRVLRPVLVVGAAFTRAAATASTLASGATVVAAARRFPADPTTIRLAGIVLVTALATNATLLQFTPARLRPGLPWTFAALLFAFGVVMIVASGAVARAWTRWKER